MLQVSWTQIQRQGFQLPGEYSSCNFGMIIFSRCFYYLFQIFFRCASISWIGYDGYRVFFREISDQWISNLPPITK